MASSEPDSGPEDDKPIELPISNRPLFNTEPKNKKDGFSRPRDPRFDARCSGSNDVRHFMRNYSFLDEVRQNELNELQRALRKEKDPERKNKIRTTITRIKNKIVERQNKIKRVELIDEMKKTQPTNSPNEGRKNKYKNIKKSDIKKNLLVNKYKELKESGKLTKYLERKRKKLINKDGKAFA